MFDPNPAAHEFDSCCIWYSVLMGKWRVDYSTPDKDVDFLTADSEEEAVQVARDVLGMGYRLTEDMDAVVPL